MAITHDTATRNAIADTVAGRLNGGTLEFLTSSDVVLAVLALSATAAPAASGGVATFSIISPDTSADATGTAAKARLKSSGGTVVIDGATVSASVGGGDIIVSTTSFVAGAQISVSSLTYTAPV